MKVSSLQLRFIFIISTLCILEAAIPKDIHKRSPVTSQHSFEGPFSVTNWVLQGNAYFRENYVRLTPDRQSRSGAIWNNSPIRIPQWEATFEFRIFGQGNTGADGLGFWYVKETNMGSFYGIDPAFIGLGIVIDTYDNDGSGMHPRLMVLVSDGTAEFNHDHNHENVEGMEKGGCFFPCRHRNKDLRSFVRVQYTKEKTLIVETSTTDELSFSQCAVVENIDIPSGYTFGFTAATGQLADNHDIFSLTVKSLKAITSELLNQEQFIIAGLQNRFERKLEDIKSSLPESLALSPSPSYIPSSSQIDPRLSNNLEQMKTTLNTLQIEIKNEVSTFHRKLDSLSLQLNSLKSHKDKLEESLKSWSSGSQQQGQEGSQIEEEGSSLVSWSILGLLILILIVLVHFQHQTRKDLKGW